MISSSPRSKKRSVFLPDTQATASLAREFATGVSVKDIIALTGDLGAGKTEFARALIIARGKLKGVKINHVPSPTYTLMQYYELPGGAIYHFDLYRLGKSEEIWELGIEEAFADGISIIEWSDKIKELLPATTMHINFDFGKNASERIVHISST